MESQGVNISAVVRLTKEEYKDISIFYYKYIRKGKKSYIIRYVFIFIIIFLVLVTFLLNQSVPTSSTEPVIRNSLSLHEMIVRAFIPIMVIVIVLAVQIYTPFLIKKSAVKEFSSNKFAQKEFNYTLSPEYIEIESEDFQMKLKYEDIHKVLVSSDYIIIFESEKLVRILPKRSFQDEKAAADALQLLESKLSKGKYVTYN